MHRVGAPPGVPRAARRRSPSSPQPSRRRRVSPRFDVVHAHQLLSPTTAALLLSAPLTRPPLLLNPHACGAHRRRGRPLRHRARPAPAPRGGAPRRRVRGRQPPDPRRAHRRRRARRERICDDRRTASTLDRFRPADRRASAPPCAARSGSPRRRSSSTPGRLAREKGVDVLVAAWPRAPRARPGARSACSATAPRRRRLGAGARRAASRTRSRFLGGVADVAPFAARGRRGRAAVADRGHAGGAARGDGCALPVVATAVGGSARGAARRRDRAARAARASPERSREALGEALRDPARARPRRGAARAHVARALRARPRRRPVPRALPRGSPAPRRPAGAGSSARRHACLKPVASRRGRVVVPHVLVPGVDRDVHPPRDARAPAARGRARDLSALRGGGRTRSTPASEQLPRSRPLPPRPLARSSSSRSCTGSGRGRAPTCARGRARSAATSARREFLAKALVVVPRAAVIARAHRGARRPARPRPLGDAPGARGLRRAGAHRDRLQLHRPRARPVRRPLDARTRRSGGALRRHHLRVQPRASSRGSTATAAAKKTHGHPLRRRPAALPAARRARAPDGVSAIRLRGGAARLQGSPLPRGRRARCCASAACRSAALLVGDGPERRALEQQIAARGLAGEVELLGAPAAGRGPRELLATADVVVHAERHHAQPGMMDGIPVALMEAMAMGLPGGLHARLGDPGARARREDRARRGAARRRRARGRHPAAHREPDARAPPRDGRPPRGAARVHARAERRAADSTGSRRSSAEARGGDRGDATGRQDS